MKNAEKTKEALIIELEEMHRKYDSLKEVFEKELQYRENEKLWLEKLSKASEELIQFHDETHDYTKILETLSEISGAKFAAFNVFDQNGLGFTTVAVTGIKDIYLKAVSFLGFNIINKHWDHDPVRAEKIKGQTITRFERLHELTGEAILKNTILLIERTFNVGEVFIIKVTRDTRVIGDFTLMFQKGETLINSKLVNLYAQQVGLFIERNSITNSLKLSHALHSAMIANISDVIGIVSVEGIIKYISPNVEKWFGWKPQDLVGSEIWPNIHPDEVKKIQNELLTILQHDNSSVTVDYMAKCGDGNYKLIRMTAVNLINDTNIRGILVNFRDITERKQSQDLLQKSELRYKSLFKYSPSGIVIIDQNGIILEANEAFTRITLYSLDELIGHNVSLLTLPGYEYTVAKNIKRILSGEVLEQEVQSQRKDGTFCTLLLREIAILLPDGSKGVLSVSNDISERKKAEEELAVKNDELLEIVAEKDKFFSIISHDLRSPFNGFLGLTQMMADDLTSMTLTEIQTIASSMSKSASNLYRLLENLLEWSRMEQGLIPFNPRHVTLREIMDEGLSIVLQSAEQKGISVSFNIPEDTGIFADSNIFETVIRNLVSNAVKFTPKGGQVNISARITEQKNLEISVKDSGIGMKKEILKKLFLITGNISRRGTDDEPSSGLGLFLCKGFIEKHGGSIWAESEEGKGSVFYFSIPITEIGN